MLFFSPKCFYDVILFYFRCLSIFHFWLWLWYFSLKHQIMHQRWKRTVWRFLPLGHPCAASTLEGKWPPWPPPLPKALGQGPTSIVLCTWGPGMARGLVTAPNGERPSHSRSQLTAQLGSACTWGPSISIPCCGHTFTGTLPWLLSSHGSLYFLLFYYFISGILIVCSIYQLVS